MEDEGMIYEIKSKYILKHILNYIGDKNYPLKLFYNSNSFQKKLELNFSSFYKKCLNSIGFDIYEFLCKYEDNYQKGFLAYKYNEFILKKNFNKEQFGIFLLRVLNEENERNKELIVKYINIDSPLLGIVTKTKNFNKYYAIYISQKNIDDFKLKDDFIKIFNQLNNLNIIYSIYYIFDDIMKLDYLTNLNINCNIVQKIILEYKRNIFYSNNYSKIVANVFDAFQNLECLHLRGDIINILENVSFKNLKELNSSSDEILSISSLEKIDSKRLEILDLSSNEIRDITILEKVCFIKLKELNLSHNKISYIGVFQKVKFEKLEKLFLNGNELRDINGLEEANFKQLKELNLSHNKISDIGVLEKVKFDKLEKLDLSKNRISNINNLENANFIQLKELNLAKNNISNIFVLTKVKFNQLEKLSFFENRISDISVFEKVNLTRLNELNLAQNQIWDIKVFEKVKFDKSIKIDLRWNNYRKNRKK